MQAVTDRRWVLVPPTTGIHRRARSCVERSDRPEGSSPGGPFYAAGVSIRPVAALLALMLVAAGCATTLDVNIRTEAGGPISAGPDEPADTDEPGSIEEPTADPTAEPTAVPTVEPTPEPLPDLGYEEAIGVYFADVERFWGREAGKLGISAFAPVDDQIPYDPSEPGAVPTCGGELGPLAIYVGNAFYCSPDDYIAWDDVGLFPDLYDQYGDFTVGLVIAHEYAHAVQARANLDGPTIFVELQADCLAGAWAGAVAAGASEVLFDPTDLDNAIGGFLTFADPLGTPAGDPTAHGTAFDRLNAFAEGFELGVDACPAFLTNPPQTASLTVDLGDENAGDLPLASLLPILVDDLTNYLDIIGRDLLGPDFVGPQALVEFGAGIGDPADCGGLSVDAQALAGSVYYCELTRTVAIDRAELESAWNDAGDFAPAYAVAHAYATSVASPLGATAADVILVADCIVGVWARNVFEATENPPPPRVHSVFLSAGDLDEGIVGLLTIAPVGVSLAPTGPIAVFDRVAAFTDGFFDGSSSCAR